MYSCYHMLSSRATLFPNIVGICCTSEPGNICYTGSNTNGKVGTQILFTLCTGMWFFKAFFASGISFHVCVFLSVIPPFAFLCPLEARWHVHNVTDAWVWMPISCAINVHVNTYIEGVKFIAALLHWVWCIAVPHAMSLSLTHAMVQSSTALTLFVKCTKQLLH